VALLSPRSARCIFTSGALLLKARLAPSCRCSSETFSISGMRMHIHSFIVIHVIPETLIAGLSRRSRRLAARNGRSYRNESTRSSLVVGSFFFLRLLHRTVPFTTAVIVSIMRESLLQAESANVRVTRFRPRGQMKFVSFAARAIDPVFLVKYSFDACISLLSVQISSSLLRPNLLRLSTPRESERAASRNTEVRRVRSRHRGTPEWKLN